MPTLGELVRTWEERFFVNRGRELAAFRRWLENASEQPGILNVTGPGGVGKTALLGAFRRLAEQEGRQVAVADGGMLQPIPDEFLRAVGGATIEDVVSRLNASRPLLLVDRFQEMSSLSRFFLDEFLPRLDAANRVVVAGRAPIPQFWARDDCWQRLILPMPLTHFSRADSRTYLLRRGVPGHAPLVDEIVAATHGHPLGLSLAADLVQQRHLGSLRNAPEWPLVVRSLVERLHETEDPEVRALLEAASLLREFDEGMLAAITGQPPGSAAFAQLCRLSIVRPSPHGLALHDDVRHILATDLGWRDPVRYASLRHRALAHYRERADVASPSTREWLLTDRLFLWEDSVVQALLFGDEPSGEVWLDDATPTDHVAVAARWQEWLQASPSLAGEPQSARATSDALEAVLAWQGTTLRVARDPIGQVIGFSTLVALSRDIGPLLDRSPALARLVHAHLGVAGLESLPTVPDPSSPIVITHLVYAGDRGIEAGASLLRDLVGMLAHGGTYLCIIDGGLPQGLIEALGFEEVWSGADPTAQDAKQIIGYALDLARTGVEVWVEALLAGRRLPRGLSLAALAREIQVVLLHWNEDGWLARSVVWEAAPFARVPMHQRGPTTLRARITAVLRRMSIEAEAQQRIEYRALELVYLTRGVSHEAAAERLGVSRATLYRLLRRGVQGLAQALQNAHPEAPGPVVETT